MTEERNEHIDQLFKDQFDHVEVRFNTDHWQKLQHVLATGAVVGTTLTPWMRLLKRIRNHNIMVIFSTVVLVASLLFWLTRPKEDVRLSPENVNTEELIPSHEFSQEKRDSSLLFESNDLIDALKPGDQRNRAITDSANSPHLAGPISLDSIVVDSLKLKDSLFIFW